jgi:glycosyltransferase involved in cell wall biosynthesis
MKVLFVEPFAHREGHPSFESKRVCYALVDSGTEITLVTFMGLQDDWANRDKKVAHVSVFPRTNLGFRLQNRLNQFALVRSLLRISEALLTLSRAIWMNRKGQYDLIHVFDAEPTFFSCLTLSFFFRGSHFVITVYNPPPSPRKWDVHVSRLITKLDFSILTETLRYLVRKAIESKPSIFLRSLLYQKALQNSNILFVCHTKQMQRAYATYMEGRLYDRFACIPLGVETSQEQISTEYAKQRLGLPRGKSIFLSFGNNHPGKDFEVIFQASSGLATDFLLLHVGKLGAVGEEGDPQRLAKKYGFSQNTIVKDVLVPEEEKILYFVAADAVILSYKKDFIQSASILNDAAKSSTPVIASDVGQLGEYVRSYHLGVTFAPEDANSLQQAIISFLALSDKEKEEIKENFAKFVAAHPWEENARSHLAAYEKVLEG